MQVCLAPQGAEQGKIVALVPGALQCQRYAADGMSVSVEGSAEVTHLPPRRHLREIQVGIQVQVRAGVHALLERGRCPDDQPCSLQQGNVHGFIGLAEGVGECKRLCAFRIREVAVHGVSRHLLDNGALRLHGELPAGAGRGAHGVQQLAGLSVHKGQHRFGNPAGIQRHIGADRSGLEIPLAVQQNHAGLTVLQRLAFPVGLGGIPTLQIVPLDFVQRECIAVAGLNGDKSAVPDAEVLRRAVGFQIAVVVIKGDEMVIGSFSAVADAPARRSHRAQQQEKCGKQQASEGATGATAGPDRIHIRVHGTHSFHLRINVGTPAVRLTGGRRIRHK